MYPSHEILKKFGIPVRQKKEKKKSHKPGRKNESLKHVYHENNVISLFEDKMIHEFPSEVIWDKKDLHHSQGRNGQDNDVFPNSGWSAKDHSLHRLLPLPVWLACGVDSPKDQLLAPFQK